MLSQISITAGQQHFILFQEKVVLWVEENTLLLSDLHAGKASLFRKHGIPLSNDHLLNDLNNLQVLIRRLKPDKLVVLGDLFHSEHNDENAMLVEWIQAQETKFILVEGNHDIHDEADYHIKRVESISNDNLLLCHEPADYEGKFQLNGHLHPAYRISGKARQSMRFPCYYISPERLILPAFGSLTGSKTVKKRKLDQIVLITPDGLIKL
ncbi:MAG: ligase-associated DNA damage response endonuclease PdeM [Bacteroidia bacterium]